MNDFERPLSVEELLGQYQQQPAPAQPQMAYQQAQYPAFVNPPPQQPPQPLQAAQMPPGDASGFMFPQQMQQPASAVPQQQAPSPVPNSADVNLGQALRSGAVKVMSEMGIGDAQRDPKGTYERGQKIVPDSIRANEGEIPIRQYDIAVLRTRLKFMRAEGRMQITNKRLLFRAAGRSLMGRTTLQHEFNLNEIGGVEIRKDWRFSFFDFFFTTLLCLLVEGLLSLIVGFCYENTQAVGIILGTLVGIAGVVPFFMLKKKHLTKALTCAAGIGGFYGVYNAAKPPRRMSGSMFGAIAPSVPAASSNGWSAIFLIAGIIALVFAAIAVFLMTFKPNLVVIIKTKGAAGAVEICRDRSKGLMGLFGGDKNKSEYTGYAEVLPTDSTDSAIKEIGAMVNDIQTLGDHGVAKWRA